MAPGGSMLMQSCSETSTWLAWRQRAIVVDDKATRVRQFHHNTLTALADLVGAAGLADPNELRPLHILRRIAPTEVRSFAEVYPFLEPGELLAGTRHAQYAEQWAMADASRFAPLPPIRSAA